MPTFATQSNPMEKKQFMAMAGDAATFTKQLMEFEKDHEIIEKHISTQVIQMAAPVTAIVAPGQQQAMINTVLVSAYIGYIAKPSKPF